MNKLSFCSLKAVMLVCTLGAAGCVGQQVSYPSSRTPTPDEIEVIPITPAFVKAHPELSTQPATAAVAVEGGVEFDVVLPKPEAYRYVIKPGDVLDISVPSLVFANSATSGPSILNGQERGYLVYDDGTVYLPFAGSIKVGGLTQQGAQERVVRSLTQYLKRPEVVVSIRDFRSQRVLITGQVQKPGYMPITDLPLTVIGALSNSGVLAKQRGGADPRIIGGNQQQQALAEAPDLRNVILRRGKQDFTIDVDAILASGNTIQDAVLMDGDMLIVPSAARANVFVLGEIARPALVEISPKRTDLAQVLMASGGLNQLTSNASRVYVIRGGFEKPAIYQLNAKSPESMLLAQTFEILPKDVVYVSEAGITRWNRLLQGLLPTLQGLLSTAVIVNTTDNLNN